MGMMGIVDLLYWIVPLGIGYFIYDAYLSDRVMRWLNIGQGRIHRL